MPTRLRRLAAPLVLLCAPLITASTASAQQPNTTQAARGGRVIGEAAVVLVADGLGAAAGWGVAEGLSAAPCDDGDDFFDGCALGALAGGIAVGHVTALFTAPLFVDYVGGDVGSYWSAFRIGALGMAGGFAIAVPVAVAFEDDDRMVLGAMIALPALGHAIGTVAGYEGSVEAQPRQARWVPVVAPRDDGAVAGVTGTF